MPAFYSAVDLFALCSRTESFGLALAEAMACRRPVIATPTSGATRQISHLHNGWQLDSFDPPRSRTQSPRWPPTARPREHGNKGRDTVIRQFNIDLTLEQTLRALRGPSREQSGLCRPGTNEQPFAAMTAEDCA